MQAEEGPTMLLRRYPIQSRLPRGWQPQWAAACVIELPEWHRHDVCRALPGTPLAPDTEATSAHGAEVTAADIAQAATAVATALKGVTSNDALVATYQRALEDPTALADAIRRWRGLPHPLAMFAPWPVRTARAAEAIVRSAEDLWDDTCATATIRTTETGYAVFAGAQGYHAAHGTAASLEAAIRQACDLVLETRKEAVRRIKATLPGWDAATPIAGYALASLPEAPVVIYRAPLLAREMEEVPALTVAPDGRVLSSKDVPWDDEVMRRSVLAERAELDVARYQRTQCLLRALRDRPGFPDVFNAKGTLDGKRVLTLRTGERGRLAGVVRQEPDGRIALAFIPEGGRSRWVRANLFLHGSAEQGRDARRDDRARPRTGGPQ